MRNFAEKIVTKMLGRATVVARPNISGRNQYVGSLYTPSTGGVAGGC